MKGFWLLIICLGWSFGLRAGSIDRLGNELTQNDTSDFQKVYHFYDWIARNIEYDIKAWQKLQQKTHHPQQIIRKKKATSQEYTALFQALCKSQNIPCISIKGYSIDPYFKISENHAYPNHTWNVVLIDSTWKLADLTKASGYLSKKENKFDAFLFDKANVPYTHNQYEFVAEKNDDFFLAKPKFFIQHNFPITSQWQFLKDTIPYSIFELGKDSIQTYTQETTEVETDFYAFQPFYEKTEILQNIEMGEQGVLENTQNTSFVAYAHGKYGYHLYQKAQSLKYDTLQKLEYMTQSHYHLKKSNEFFRKTRNNYHQLNGIIVHKNKVRNKKIMTPNKRDYTWASRILRGGEIEVNRKERSNKRLKKGINRQQDVILTYGHYTTFKKHLTPQQRNSNIQRYEENVKENLHKIAKIYDTIQFLSTLIQQEQDTLYKHLKKINTYQIAQNELIEKRINCNIKLESIDQLEAWNQEIDQKQKYIKLQYKVFQFYFRKSVRRHINERHRFVLNMKELVKQNAILFKHIESNGKGDKKLLKQNKDYKELLEGAITLRLQSIIAKNNLILEKVKDEHNALLERKKLLNLERDIEYKRYKESEKREQKRHSFYWKNMVNTLRTQDALEKKLYQDIKQLKKAYRLNHPNYEKN
ncbi:MAG: hypothetical protein GY827_09825 [Cytophagales bacterium]|nr:hypothetical protein [Cytophagales bacterium]